MSTWNPLKGLRSPKDREELPTRETEAELRRQVAEARAELAAAIAEADRASQAKNLFLANMSHEFRTPMGAVIGYAEMLLYPQLDSAERAKIVRAISRNGRHLMSLINDILDFTKIEAGMMRLERVSCKPWRIVGEAATAAWVPAEEKAVELNVAMVGSLPRTLTTDPTRLRQVLDNLLSNAVKFTPPGGQVDLRVRIDGERGAAPEIAFEVEDRGVGMTPEVIARLFEPFVQADATTTRRYGGTGLGLSICHRIVAALGGRIAVRSQPGKGSCFTVLLPVAPRDLEDMYDEETAARDTHPKPLNMRAKGMSQMSGLSGRVLLAEDDPDNQNILRFFLERAGLTVELVDDGEKAVAAAMAGAFDFVLMDMQMPRLDGYGATAELRRRGFKPPIIALTANTLSGSEEKCREAGCDGYLTKPLEIERLAGVLNRLARRVQPRSPRPIAPARPFPSPAKATAPATSGDGDLEILRNRYTASLPEKVAEFQAALESGNRRVLVEIAHRLRGSAAMYGLNELAETAALIEGAVREGRDFDLLADLVSELIHLSGKRSGERVGTAQPSGR